jgi:hypothetical protein
MGTEFISRSYKFPQETLDQLQALDERIKGKTKRDIIVEAISMMAAEHGVGKRKENSFSIDQLAKKLADQRKLINILCKTCLRYEFKAYQGEGDEEINIRQELKAIDKIIDAKSTEQQKPQELYNAVKKELPEALKTEMNFKLYLGLRDRL